MSAGNGRPLEKELVASVRFVFAYFVIQIAVLKAQPIELAQVPGEKR